MKSQVEERARTAEATRPKVEVRVSAHRLAEGDDAQKIALFLAEMFNGGWQQANAPFSHGLYVVYTFLKTQQPAQPERTGIPCT